MSLTTKDVKEAIDRCTERKKEETNWENAHYHNSDEIFDELDDFHCNQDDVTKVLEENPDDFYKDSSYGWGWRNKYR